ncbi:hypothetical protein Pint_25375 [Pistacia integerrima]|uniref:Uncharacterized protein n=1 Tax=Pistacia integerrima TaxID=434235 RepID=A0ACC0YC30_9ROSI|nr:hypothetical protein Pint_25375 [Pistacia integerrima]
MPLHSVTASATLVSSPISRSPLSWYDSLQDVKSEYVVYESILFGKVKEGIDVVASHPLITSGVAIGFGSVVLKSTP